MHKFNQGIRILCLIEQLFGHPFSFRPPTSATSANTSCRIKQFARQIKQEVMHTLMS